MSIKAVAHISRFAAARKHASCWPIGGKFVVKFMGNPQCTKVLANDYLACRMARMIGLSVPNGSVFSWTKRRSADFVALLAEHVPDRYRHAVRYFGLWRPAQKVGQPPLFSCD